MTDEEIYANMRGVAEWQAREAAGPDYDKYITAIRALAGEVDSLYYEVLEKRGKGRYQLFQAANHLGSAIDCLAEARDE